MMPLDAQRAELAFSSNVYGDTDIFVAALDGTELFRVRRPGTDRACVSFRAQRGGLSSELGLSS
jgi:hypothetical protein